MNDQQRLFSAIAISVVILLGWQVFVSTQAPPPGQRSGAREEARKQNKASGASAQEAGQAPSARQSEQQEGAAASWDRQSVVVGNGENQVKIWNDLTLVEFHSKHGQFPYSFILGKKEPFQILFFNDDGFGPREFQLELQDGGRRVVGRASQGAVFEGGFDSQGRFRFSLRSGGQEFVQFVLRSEGVVDLEKIPPEITEDSSLFANSGQRQYLIFSKDVNRLDVGDEENNPGTLVKWFGLSYGFHLFAVVFEEPLSMAYSSRADGRLLAKTVSPVSQIQGQFVFTKKSYELLKGLGDNLQAALDLGWFSFIGVPILKGLQFFYGFVKNYGVAIILLTIVIRMLTFPLQFKSYKSMKKMQKLQPEMTKIREKFKDDPPRMQRETMELFKKSGANPLGGCLPMLLQIPIFFAFYQVLLNSVDLIGAPFALWLTDLSVKDPYYVLPLLMAAVMLLQQKLMPTASADPTQKKIMMFMPIIFGFIMKDLPSGLTLYILVSTVFAIFQQKLVYRIVD